MIIIRYDEIGLKGGNRPIFEKKLIENMEEKITKAGYSISIKRLHNRILANTDSPHENFMKIFGIRSISPAIESTHNIEDIYSEIKKILLNKKFETFRISTQRLWKDYWKKSTELNEILGEMVLRDFQKKVKLVDPDIDIGIEILEDRSLIFTEKYPGPGGLPYGIEGKVLMLISGGIDSPVAAYLLMKRGADITFLHYKTNDEILKKVKNLINILESYAPKSLDLIVEEHEKLLENVISNLEKMGKRRWTCVFCKYSMLKRAEEIAKNIGAYAIGTGESLGEVASQTLNNIMVENLAVQLPVFRPLIGFDKLEIVNLAKKIGTFNESISVKGCGCPFLPIHPITNATIEEFIKIRENAFEKNELGKKNFTGQGCF